jgi:hypothetical protein
MTIKAIAQFLDIDKAVVREHISQTLRKVVDELAGGVRATYLPARVDRPRLRCNGNLFPR